MDSKKNETPLHEMETLVGPDGTEFLPEPSEANDDPEGQTQGAEDAEEEETSV
jgi:hypothetical protein